MKNKRTIRVSLFGPEENLSKVQDIMAKHDGLCRKLDPRVRYETFEPERLHYEVEYDLTEKNYIKLIEKKKLAKYCTSINAEDLN